MKHQKALMCQYQDNCHTHTYIFEERVQMVKYNVTKLQSKFESFK